MQPLWRRGTCIGSSIDVVETCSGWCLRRFAELSCLSLFRVAVIARPQCETATMRC